MSQPHLAGVLIMTTTHRHPAANFPATPDLFADQQPTPAEHYRRALRAARKMRIAPGREKVRQGERVCTHLLDMLSATRVARSASRGANH